MFNVTLLHITLPGFYFKLCNLVIYIIDLRKSSVFIEAVVRRCSVKKVFLKISRNSQENTCARVSFLNIYLVVYIFSIFLAESRF